MSFLLTSPIQVFSFSCSTLCSFSNRLANIYVIAQLEGTLLETASIFFCFFNIAQGNVNPDIFQHIRIGQYMNVLGALIHCELYLNRFFISMLYMKTHLCLTDTLDASFLFSSGRIPWKVKIYQGAERLQV